MNKFATIIQITRFLSVVILLSGCYSGDELELNQPTSPIRRQLALNNEEYNPTTRVYPDVTEISASSVVISQMEQAWQKTLENCNPENRRRRGVPKTAPKKIYYFGPSRRTL